MIVEARKLVWLLLLATLSTAAWSQTPPPGPKPTKPSDIPVDYFFRRPVLSAPQISPSGTHVAVLVVGDKGRTVLAVAEVANPTKLVGVARFDDADIRDVQWVNDNRLVFSLVDFQSPLGEQFGGGLYAVNRDSSEFVFLVGRGRDFETGGHIAIRPLRWNHLLLTTLDDGSDDIIVQRYNIFDKRDFGQEMSTSLMRLDTKTKGTQLITKFVPAGAQGWVLDQRTLTPAAYITVAKNQIEVFARSEGAKDAFVKIDGYDLFTEPPGSLTPFAVDANGLLVLKTQDDAQRTSALYRYDVAQRKVADKPLMSLKGYDFSGALVTDRKTGELLGVHYVTDAEGTEWLNPTMRGIQVDIDRQLPGTINALRCKRCLSAATMVVTAYSDRESGIHFLYDVQSKKLTPLGAERPWIDPKLMAARDFVTVQTRDGLPMPVHVTKPQGKGPWPAVILVHGGPYVRGGVWGWSPDGQFLASRGYLVVEPEFRGSTGFGGAYFRAGWKQWGLKMQDDVTDATNWAVAQGLADPKRLVIAGASYGGYATMMGLVKEPDLYRAGINWVGVTDIDMLYDIDWSDFSEEWQRFGMPKLIGDQKKDAAQLEATSPLKQAHRITKPVLMAYGDKDVRVPLPHGTEMRDALLKHGKVPVEWVVYKDEGHGWLLLENHVDFWTRVEKFLAKNTQ